MLDACTIDRVLPLAELLEARGRALVPVPESPLAVLCRNTNYDPKVGQDPQSGHYVVNPAMVADASTEEVFGTEAPHAAEMEAAVQQLADVVGQQLSFIKNEVKGTVEDLVQTAHARMTSAAVSVIQKYGVEKARSDSPLLNEGLWELVKNYDGIPPMPVSVDFDLPQQTDDELRALLRTGLTDLDQEVLEYVAADGGLLRWLWDHVFCRQSGKLHHQHVQELLQDPKYGAQNTLALFLLSHKLINEVLEGTVANIGTYRVMMGQLRNQAGRQLVGLMQRAHSSVRQEQLVQLYSGTKVLVNPTTYMKFMSTGGSNEILLGALLSGENRIHIPTIMEKAQEYLQLWQRHVQMTTAAEQTQYYNNAITALTQAFDFQIQKVTEDEKLRSGSSEVVRRKFAEVLRTVTEREIKEDLYAVAVKLVCRSRYHYTDAETFLMDMADICRSNPAMDPREAALVATVKYITAWLASQMQVITIPGHIR